MGREAHDFPRASERACAGGADRARAKTNSMTAERDTYARLARKCGRNCCCAARDDASPKIHLWPA